MKKSKLLGLSLCALVLFGGGCSCNKKDDTTVEANIKNGSDTYLSGLKENANNKTLEELYKDLRAESGNEQVENNF